MKSVELMCKHNEFGVCRKRFRWTFTKLINLLPQFFKSYFKHFSLFEHFLVSVWSHKCLFGRKSHWVHWWLLPNAYAQDCTHNITQLNTCNYCIFFLKLHYKSMSLIPLQTKINKGDGNAIIMTQQVFWRENCVGGGSFHYDSTFIWMEPFLKQSLLSGMGTIY